MKARPILFSAPMVRALLAHKKTQTRRIIKGNDFAHAKNCPYGQKFDLLWVRETAYVWNAGYKDGSGKHISYRADDPDAPVGCWTPSIHMYRFASRITLTITNVRVQRLQDISSDDALAEGVECTEFHDPAVCNAVDEYRQLWESINGKGSWEANPWVWALTFMVHKQNVKDFLF